MKIIINKKNMSEESDDDGEYDDAERDYTTTRIRTAMMPKKTSMTVSEHHTTPDRSSLCLFKTQSHYSSQCFSRCCVGCLRTLCYKIKETPFNIRIHALAV